MGSPSARLNVPERLRPWLESGLEYVYAPGAAAEAVTAVAGGDQAAPVPSAFADAPESESRPRAPQRTEFPASPAQPAASAARVKRSARPATPAPPPSASFAAPNANQPTNRPLNRTAPAAPPAQPASGRAGGRTAPSSPSGPGVDREPGPGAGAPFAFPEPWASYLRLVPPGHKMVWTYLELGLDLGGQKDDRRRTLIATLIRHLRLPPRPVAFWPVAVLRQGRLVPDRDLFWRGWRCWHTPHVVCFGEESARVILPDADPSRSTYLFRDVMVHVLPSLGRLVSLLPHEQLLAVESLAGLRL